MQQKPTDTGPTWGIKSGNSFRHEEELRKQFWASRIALRDYVHKAEKTGLETRKFYSHGKEGFARD